MTSLWDFKVGDRVFCVWPTDELAGGFYKVIDVTLGHIKVEGFKYYCDKGRFVLMNPYVSPINKAFEAATKAALEAAQKALELSQKWDSYWLDYIRGW